MPICISRKDRQRRIYWANNAYCLAERVTREELLTRKNTDLLLYGAERDLEYGEGDRKVLESGKPFFAVENHGTGENQRMVQVVKTPIIEPGGEVIGLEAIFWDLLDIEKIQQIETQFQAQYNVIVEHDLDFIVSRVNRAAAELRGRGNRSHPGRGGFMGSIF